MKAKRTPFPPDSEVNELVEMIKRDVWDERLAKLPIGVRAGLGAIAARDGHLMVDEAARRVRVGRSAIGAARKILMQGSAREWDDFKSGRRSLTQIYENFGKTDEELQAQQERADAAQREKRKNEVKLWETLSDAIVGLTSIPAPGDMVNVCLAHHKRGYLMDTKLESARKWLEEFAHEWKNRPKGSRNNHADAGTGDEASGK